MQNKELTIEGYEQTIAKEYEEYQKEVDNVRAEGFTDEEVESASRAGWEDSLAEAGATEEEAKAVLEELEGDISFPFGANVKTPSVPGEQQALFQAEEQVELNRAKSRVPEFHLANFPDDLKSVETVFTGVGRPRIPKRRPAKNKAP